MNKIVRQTRNIVFTAFLFATTQLGFGATMSKIVNYGDAILENAQTSGITQRILIESAKLDYLLAPKPACAQPKITLPRFAARSQNVVIYGDATLETIWSYDAAQHNKMKREETDHQLKWQETKLQAAKRVKSWFRIGISNEEQTPPASSASGKTTAKPAAPKPQNIKPIVPNPQKSEPDAPAPRGSLKRNPHYLKDPHYYDDFMDFLAQASKIDRDDLAENKRPDVVLKIKAINEKGVAYIPADRIAEIAEIADATATMDAAAEKMVVRSKKRTFEMEMKTASIQRGDTLYFPIRNLRRAFDLTRIKVMDDETVKVSPPFYSTTLLIETTNPDLPSYGATSEAHSIKYYTAFHYDTREAAQSALEQLQARDDVSQAQFNGFVQKDDEENQPQQIVPRETAVDLNQSAKDAVGYDDYIAATGGANADLPEIVVAVVDGGFNSTDPLFDGRIVPGGGWNVLDNNNDVINLLNEHGTEVAGCVAQFSRDNVKILPIRTSEGTETLMSSAADGVDYAIEQDVNVINTSFGFGGVGFTSCIIDAYKADIIWVASAGNSKMDSLSQSPANLQQVITVGAIDSHQEGYPIARGFTNFGEMVDTYAPGVTIYMPLEESLDGSWSWSSGTSLSSPIVAGLIADVLGYQDAHGTHYLNAATANLFVRTTNTINTDTDSIRFNPLALNNARINNTFSYSSGLGTSDNPFIISTEGQLQSLAWAVHNGLDCSDYYFCLGDDITLSDPWIPIGYHSSGTTYDANHNVNSTTTPSISQPFSGNFDGDGKTITINTGPVSAAPSTVNLDFGGLFGYVKDGNIKDVDVVIGSSGITTQSGTEYWQACFGGLVGYLQSGTVECCSVSGGQIIAGSSYITIGGLIGQDLLNASTTIGSILNCYTNLSICGSTMTNYASMGGALSACATYTGGLIGSTDTLSNDSIVNCYSASSITLQYTNVSAGYKNAGTLVGFAATGSTVENCYWKDYGSSPSGYTAGPFSSINDNSYGPCTDVQLTNQSTFSGWDFTNTWKIDPAKNNGYPILRHTKPFTAEVTLDNLVYGDTPEPTVTNNPGGGTVTYEYSASENGTYSTTVPTDAGDYWIKATIAEANNYAEVTTAPYQFSISKANITPEPTVTLDNLVYGDTPEPTVTNNPGGGAVTFEYSASEGGTYSMTVPTDAGDYWIRATIAATTNYFGATTAPQSFSISKANIAPAVTLDSWVYGEAAKTPAVSGNSGGGAVTFEYSASEGGTYSTTVPSDAGTYWVRATIAEANNYAEVTTAPYQFSILKASLIPTVTLGNWVYGETPKTPTVSGNSGGGAVTYEYSASESGTYSTTVPTNAGDYWVRATIAESNNYAEVTTTPYQFSILKASLIPTVTLGNWVYGETPKTPAVSGNSGGGAVTYEYSASESGTYSTTVPTNAGDYWVRATIAESNNYAEITTAPYQFSISKANITPAVTLDSWVYGETAKTPAMSGNSGGGAVTYTYYHDGSTDGQSNYWVGNATNAGYYLITANVAETDNYQSGLAMSNFAITKAPLTITAEDKVRTVGEENPEFTLTYSGFKNGEDKNVLDVLPVISCGANINSPAGVYDIVLSGGSDHNYEYALANGLLTVTQLYGVSIGTFSGGSVAANTTSAAAGETVALTISPDEGYELHAIEAYKTNDPATIVTLNGSAFTMPDYAVTVAATFQKTQNQLNKEAVEAAKAAIEGMSGIAVAQADANTEAAVKSWLATQINAIAGMSATGITVSAANITLSGFNAAAEGTTGTPAGSNGSFNFTVSLAKGASSANTASKAGTVTATAYVYQNYTVTVTAATNGSVSVVPGNPVKETETVTLTISPAAGYELDAISACKTGDKSTTIVLNVANAVTRTFKMPSYDVTVTATFKKSQITLDTEAVATAKTAIEGRSYTVDQASANTEAAVKAWLATQINDLIASTGITVTAANITISNFTVASGGANGSFNFTVALTEGSATGSASKSGTISAIPVYSVTVATATNGSVSASKTAAVAQGETITLTISPAAGYEMDAISACKTGEPATIVTISGNTFTMPAFDVTIKATFKESQATIDARAVANAKTAIEGGSYTVNQAVANTEATVKTWLATQINALAGMSATGITITAADITLNSFTVAAGGVNGSFNFTVALAKGGATGSASKSGTISAIPVYTVTVSTATNGSVSANKTTAIAQGETITLTISPDEGYELDAISAYKTADKSAIIVLNVPNVSTRTFTMPGYAVTVTATFKKTQDQSDKEALEATNTAVVEGGTYRIAQATGNTAADVKTWLVGTLNVMFGQLYDVQFRSSASIVGDVTITTLTPAIAGTADNPDGVNGSFLFTVDLAKGGNTISTGNVSGIIVATPFKTEKSIELTKLGELTVQVANTGNVATGKLTLTLSGKNADVFTLSPATIDDLAINGETNITLIPNSGLADGTYTATLTVSGDGLESQSIEISHNVLTLSVEDIANQLTVFPNPAHSEIFIKSDLKINRVEIYSLTGALLLMENNFNGKIVISTLPKGVYMLRIYTDNGLVIRKVMKE